MLGSPSADTMRRVATLLSELALTPARERSGADLLEHASTVQHLVDDLASIGSEDAIFALATFASSLLQELEKLTGGNAVVGLQQFILTGEMT